MSYESVKLPQVASLQKSKVSPGTLHSPRRIDELSQRVRPVHLDISYLSEISRKDVEDNGPRWGTLSVPAILEAASSSPRPKTTPHSPRKHVLPREAVVSAIESHFLVELMQRYGEVLPSSTVPEKYHVTQDAPLSVDPRQVNESFSLFLPAVGAALVIAVCSSTFLYF